MTFHWALRWLLTALSAEDLPVGEAEKGLPDDT
jgi:hypothetical protein